MVADAATLLHGEGWLMRALQMPVGGVLKQAAADGASTGKIKSAPDTPDSPVAAE